MLYTIDRWLLIKISNFNIKSILSLADIVLESVPSHTDFANLFLVVVFLTIGVFDSAKSFQVHVGSGNAFQAFVSSPLGTERVRSFSFGMVSGKNCFMVAWSVNQNVLVVASTAFSVLIAFCAEGTVFLTDSFSIDIVASVTFLASFGIVIEPDTFRVLKSQKGIPAGLSCWEESGNTGEGKGREKLHGYFFKSFGFEL